MKHKLATILEYLGASFGALTLLDVSHAFYFLCGGLFFVIGAIIKWSDHRRKKDIEKD